MVSPGYKVVTQVAANEPSTARHQDTVTLHSRLGFDQRLGGGVGHLSTQWRALALS